MKTKLLSGIMAAIISMSISIAAYADGIEYSVSYDYANSSVTVTVDSLGDEYITMQVLDKDKTFVGVALDDVIYMAQKTADEPGKYSFKIDYDLDSYEYNALLASSNGINEKFTLLLVDPEDLDNAVEALNQAAEEDNFADFANVINDKRMVLNYAFELSDEKTLYDELNDYFAYVKKNKLTSSEQEKNAKIFNTFITMYHLNNSTIDTIDGFKDELYVSDASLANKYNGIVISDVIAKYFTGKLSGNNIKTLEAYDEYYKKALVLTGIRYAKGYGEVKNLLEDYGTLFGITGTAKWEVYTAMAGKDYNAANIKGAYDALVKASNEDSAPIIQGGSGGPYKMDSLPQQTEITEMNIGFEDIDSVQWATEAIYALADKGIINGTSTTTFSPDENVTREQFAKILVIALGLDDEEVINNVFIDADDDAWYCKYINIAKENGIVQGVGNGVFGVGSSITREDMCVMLCNALKLRGNADVAVQTSFEDRADIADYAVEAVEVLYGMGAVNGMSDATFAPKAFATRAQATKVVYGVLDKLQ